VSPRALLALVILAVVQTSAPAAAQVTIAGGGGVASGSILLIDAGSCPTGFTEVTAARGRFVVGTPNGGTVAGTAGSAMTDLQNPSVTPTFTGSALSTHQHAESWAAQNGPRSAASEIYGLAAAQNVNWNELSVGATGVNNIAASLTSAVSAGTPAGTVSAVAGNSIAPYIQLVFCKKT
jgi:hypothetical protein